MRVCVDACVSCFGRNGRGVASTALGCGGCNELYHRAFWNHASFLFRCRALLVIDQANIPSLCAKGDLSPHNVTQKLQFFPEAEDRHSSGTECLQVWEREADDIDTINNAEKEDAKHEPSSRESASSVRESGVTLFRFTAVVPIPQQNAPTKQGMGGARHALGSQPPRQICILSLLRHASLSPCEPSKHQILCLGGAAAAAIRQNLEARRPDVQRKWTNEECEIFTCLMKADADLSLLKVL